MSKDTLINQMIDNLAERDKEIKRLRQVIFDEGTKWYNHHTDPEKRAYWREFMGRATK